ncbi:GNAT family N-acetyltransferase [Streptomyces dysideae]|uniref:Acetyltransferase n=1 Tax=Streptomyces dysideae TaxID=909626 RepID=A0A101UX67_9ACTN|nr:GNAT family N-acetyltransferase [Streptomyces dysideae]KUO18431.1 acetyltransferase [Streptomyces dysideae]
MGNITIRPAKQDELAAVAALRRQWITEQDATPPATECADFISEFVTWAKDNESSHRCMVLLRDTEIIGMAWLALLPRVPTPYALNRASADVQCVYVVPEARNEGLGGRLIEATLAAASDLGVERVTVHSSPLAIPAYTRHGFEPSPRLLQSHVAVTHVRHR